VLVHPCGEAQVLRHPRVDLLLHLLLLSPLLGGSPV
jgi:hypothetical protein